MNVKPFNRAPHIPCVTGLPSQRFPKKSFALDCENWMWKKECDSLIDSNFEILHFNNYHLSRRLFDTSFQIWIHSFLTMYILHQQKVHTWQSCNWMWSLWIDLRTIQVWQDFLYNASALKKLQHLKSLFDLVWENQWFLDSEITES